MSVCRTMPKLLLVGTGLTGAVISSLLSKHGLTSVELSIWDKSRGSGLFVNRQLNYVINMK